VTPVKKYADLKALTGLPESQVRYRWKAEGKDLIRNLTIELHNPGPHLAFNLEIQVLKKLREKPVVPIFLEDNYISLLPGERRTVKGYFFAEDLEGDELEIRVKGWKVRAQEVRKF